MKHSDLVGLLDGGVGPPGGSSAGTTAGTTGGKTGATWADLGAGDGAFTFALAELLGPGAHIFAVDRDGGALRGIGEDMASRFPYVTVEIRTADFTKALGLPALDGILMANSLHFVRDKAPVLASLRAMLSPGGRLIVVEYGTDRGNAWVPHPFSFPTWEKLAAAAGFSSTWLLHTIPSRHLGSMYSAVSS